MRYRLRTLLILTILGPPALAGAWLVAPQLLEAYREWRRPPPVTFTVTPRIIIEPEDEPKVITELPE